ncbi:MAG: Protein-L-isoaspartate O-methyltransferase [Methanoregula sp. SKADARSKE-2]|nr:MAG: Protein-L-isoaspartate O-methyltransferase [Methanoregula sp. SKADARSKE-2]
MTPYPLIEQRRKMVEGQIRARGVRDPRVLAALEEVPRHLFIPPPYDRDAYEDSPLPIGNGQTISQPYIVAVMTELLQLRPSDRVLEIGTGSGYQAAILSRIVSHVTSAERIPELAELARRNLSALHYDNVEIIVGDGTLGYPANAPYNGILVTAASPDIPQPLTEQLADGGRMVLPAGGRDLQKLMVLERDGSSVTSSEYGGVRFVPLIGEYGWSGEGS